ncbi:MAG: sugar isomerase, partial [Clostridia bacterium]|nr:sugar isomerase [Clostridia bacterium]
MSVNTRTQNTKLNILFLLTLQLVTAVSGLILPKLMIESFGSKANGLIVSIVQFLSYISLLEGGAGGVIRAAYYKPLSENNMEKVSGIFRASRRFFLRIAFIFGFYVVALVFIFPLISNTIFDFWYIASMILILSISTILEYLIGTTYSSLIIADQKARFTYIFNIIAIILNIVAVYLLIHFGASIHI